LRAGDGALRWVENRYVPVRDKEGRLIEVEGIVIDITERKVAEEKITLLAAPMRSRACQSRNFHRTAVSGLCRSPTRRQFIRDSLSRSG